MVTSAQIKEAIRAGAYFYRDSVSEWKVISDMPEPSPPVDTGMSVVLHNTGPSFYGIYGGEVKTGPWQGTGPGNVGYYPILISGKPQLLFLNRDEHVKYEVTFEEWLTPDVGPLRDEIVLANFLEPGNPKKVIAVYEFRKLVYWNVQQGCPVYEYRARRLAIYDRKFRGIGWSNYEFVDLPDYGEKTVWIGWTNPNPALAARRPPLAEFPIKPHNSIRLMFEELAQYYRETDPSLASELSTKASRIAKWVEYWKKQGIMRRDFLDVHWPTPDYASRYPRPVSSLFSWLNSNEVFYDVEMWKKYPVALGLSIYKSHLMSAPYRFFYLRGVWTFSPYYIALYLIDLLHRGALKPRDALSMAMRISGWDGNGINLFHTYPLPSFVLDRYGDIILGRDVPPEILEVYKGDLLSSFLCLLMWIYYYATLSRDTKTANKAADIATEVLEIALKIQIPWDGRLLDHKERDLYIPNEAGAFMGAYDITRDGRVKIGNWIPPEITLFERVSTSLALQQRVLLRKLKLLDKVPQWSLLWVKPPAPWPGAASQAFETTLMCMKGMKMYKELVLGDYT